MGFFYEKCRFCNYLSDVKNNLKRHELSKHSIQNSELKQVDENLKKVAKIKKKSPKNPLKSPTLLKKVAKSRQILNFLENCQKCGKEYKTKYSLINHENNCNGFNSLTCEICMITFSNKNLKHKHKLTNKCSYRSVFDLEGHHDKKVVNNFGSERIDYLQSDIIDIMISGSNTIPFYLKCKYFNRSFPENNNIKYTKCNESMILEDGKWICKNLNILTSQLIDIAIKELLSYYDKNKEQISSKINNEEVFENIKSKLFVVHNGLNKKVYKEIFNKVKDLIKNTNQLVAS